MPFKDLIKTHREKLQAKITAESTPEQIEEITGLVADLDELESAYDTVDSERAKLKDTVVRMVLEQGSGEKPADGSTGSKPKTIEECIAEVENQGGK